MIAPKAYQGEDLVVRLRALGIVYVRNGRSGSRMDLTDKGREILELLTEISQSEYEVREPQRVSLDVPATQARIDKMSRVGPEKYIEQLRAGRRGNRIMRQRSLRFQERRDAEIVRLVRKFGPCYMPDLYGVYVQVAAENGWPIVGQRRFRDYLGLMASEGRVKLDVRSEGRAGVRTMVSSPEGPS